MNYENLLNEFRGYLRMLNYSKRTVDEYPIAVEYFLEYLSEFYITSVRDITPKHIRYFQMHLSEKTHHGKKISSATQRQYLGKVKTLFSFLFKTGKIKNDPAVHIDLPKRSKGLPRNILDVTEMHELLNQPDITTPIGMRDRAMLELFYSSGLRSSELTGLELKDVNMSNREIVVMGKGSKEALVPFGKEAHRALDNYLIFGRTAFLNSKYSGGGKLSEKRLKLEKGKEYLFISKNGHRLTKANICILLKKYLKQAGIEKNCSPHGIRHSCATHLLKFGADVRHIQQLLRHASLDTTQIYTRVNVEDLKEAQLKYHPREMQTNVAV